jgi:Tfp pilus assembly protein PilO
MKTQNFRPPVIAMIAIGLITACLAIAVTGQQITGSQLSNDLRQQRKTLKDTIDTVKEYKTLSMNYDDLSLKLGGRHRSISSSKMTVSIMNQINGIAQMQGIKLDSLRPDPATTVNNITRLTLRISFKSTLGSITRVIQSIETTVPLLHIEQLNIRAANDKSDMLQVDMTISSFGIVDKNAPELVGTINAQTTKSSPDKRKPEKQPVSGINKTASRDEVRNEHI